MSPAGARHRRRPARTGRAARVDRAERSVGVQQIGVGQAGRAGDMAAAHAGARLRHGAGEAARGARVQHQFRARFDVAQHVADAAQPGGAEVRPEGRGGRRGRFAGLRGAALASAISAIRRPALRRCRGRTTPSATSRAPPRPAPSGRRTPRARRCRRQAAPISLANRPGVGTMCGRSVSVSAIASMSKYRAPGICAARNSACPSLGSFGRYFVASNTTRSGLPSSPASQSVVTSGSMHVPRICGGASVRRRGGKSIRSAASPCCREAGHEIRRP